MAGQRPAAQRDGADAVSRTPAAPVRQPSPGAQAAGSPDMSSAKTRGPQDRVPAPAGRITDVAVNARAVEVTLRLKNDADRALHYIADIRTIRFDPATGRLVVGLSDEGRVLVPSMANVHPNIKAIDPDSEAELKLAVPLQIRKLANAPTADGFAAFEDQDLTTATEIVVEVAWSDTP